MTKRCPIFAPNSINNHFLKPIKGKYGDLKNSALKYNQRARFNVEASLSKVPLSKVLSADLIGGCLRMGFGPDNVPAYLQHTVCRTINCKMLLVYPAGVVLHVLLLLLIQIRPAF